MAFNKLSLLTVEDVNVSTVNIQYVQDATEATSVTIARDIFYHLGTDLLQSSWSNPATGSYLNLTHNQGSGTINSIMNRSSGAYTVSPVSLPLIITFELLTGFEIDLQAFRYQWSGSGSYALDTFTWEGSHDGTNWELIYGANELWELNGSASIWYYEPVLDNRANYFKWLRLNVTELRAGTVFSLAHLEIYGKLRNLTTGVAGFKTPGDRFDNLLNVDAYNPRIHREIVYDATEQIWESRYNQPWDVISETLNDDLYLTRSDLRNPRFYVLSPNGANRNIYLPPAELNDAIKFRNLDGLYALNIYEFDASQIGNNLIGYWDLDQVTNDQTDLTGITGTFLGSGMTDDTGINGTGKRFNGSNSFTVISPYNTPATSFSAAVWVNADETTDQFLLSNWDTSLNRRAWALSIQSGRFTWRTSVDGASTITASGTTTVQTGQWYHVIGTFNINTGLMKIYVNGVVEGTANQSASALGTFSQALHLGRGDNPTAYYDGLLDEAALWSRELSDSDATGLYNSGVGNFYNDITGTPPTPVVLNNAGKLQYEYVYDGTEYHLIG